MHDDIAAEGAKQGTHRISLRLEATGGHITMTMWVNGANAGALRVRNNEADILLTIAQALREGGTLVNASVSTEAKSMMHARHDFYILDDSDNPVPADSRQWAEWLEANTERRRILREEVAAGVQVSTVFLGTDYQFGDGPPILFETMVFGGPLDGEQERYSTRAEALEGHRRMVCFVKSQTCSGTIRTEANDAD